jgi:hypothetical protein
MKWLLLLTILSAREESARARTTTFTRERHVAFFFGGLIRGIF